MKHLGKFSDDDELVLLVWGQSNARPRGSANELFTAAPQLTLGAAGMDLTVTAIAGNEVTVAETLVANRWVDAELRLCFSVYGVQSPVTARVGRGKVTANGTGGLTVEWLTAAAALPAGGVVSFDGTTNRVALLTHGAQNGDQVVFAGAPLPPELTAGTVYYVTGRTTDDFQVAATFGGAPIDFDTAVSGATAAFRVGAYVVHDAVQRAYQNVRVLTPFVPEAPGSYPPGAPGELHGLTFPDTVETYEDAAAFLPFALAEGVDGIGAVGDVTSVVGLTVTCAASPLVADLYPGGYIQLTNETGQRWVAKVESNTVNDAVVEAWSPDTAPTGTLRFEISVPHWRDNPHWATPGEGFRAPSNDPQPGGFGSTGWVYNRPRGRLLPSYVSAVAGVPDYRAGAVLPLAWRLSQLLGRRINVVHLAVDGTSLAKSTSSWGGSPQRVGWWSKNVRLDWTPATDDGLAARLLRLLGMIQPALAASGSTKRARVILAVGFQGEADAGQAYARAMYAQLLPAFYEWLRKAIGNLGLSPYGSDAKVPCVHASLPRVPWETAIPGYDMDVDGLVNAAIGSWVARDGFGGTFDTNDSPKLGSDPLHFNGAGEARNGQLAAEVGIELIGRALTFSGLANDLVVQMCNQALVAVGDAAAVRSLDPPDGSAQALACATAFPQALKEFLELHAWSFASKRTALTAVTCHSQQWLYCYALPPDVLKPLCVIPASAPEEGATVYLPHAPYDRAPAPFSMEAEYSLEVDPDGYRVIYTNLPDAHLRYIARVHDPRHWPPLFVSAVARNVAAKLAGTRLKGRAGVDLGSRLQQEAYMLLTQARASDQSRRRVTPDHKAPWHRRGR